MTARGTAIFLGRRLPGVSSSLPERRIGTDRPARHCLRAFAYRHSANVLLGLAPGGVCRASRVAPAAGALLPHRFTLTAAANKTGAQSPHRGGLLSVALSRALRPVGVADHPVRWSPDFPLLPPHAPRDIAAPTAAVRPAPRPLARYRNWGRGDRRSIVRRGSSEEKTKHEIRKPKHETNSKFKTPITETEPVFAI